MEPVHQQAYRIKFYPTYFPPVQMSLYGLGLSNELTRSWQNRSFSRNVGWVSQQIFSIGVPAACILYHTWENHLTVSEVSGISYRMSQERNPAVSGSTCLDITSVATLF